MNNKELLSSIALKLNRSNTEVQDLMDAFLDSCISLIKDDKIVEFQDFGKFELVTQEEYVTVDSVTKERFLNPPKLKLSFEQSEILNEKINSKL